MYTLQHPQPSELLPTAKNALKILCIAESQRQTWLTKQPGEMAHCDPLLLLNLSPAIISFYSYNIVYTVLSGVTILMHLQINVYVCIFLNAY
jgi:hypothetical protein